MPDALVIGAGPNGLSAANLLASASWDVLVLEAESEPGGAARSGPLTGEPDFRHDLFSAFYPLGVVSPVFAQLDLAAHGLRWRRTPLAMAHPARDGSCFALSTSLDETCASLDAVSPGDGASWRRLYRWWERAGAELIDALLGGPFPPVRAGAHVAASLGRDLPAFASFGLSSVSRGVPGTALARMIAGNTLHTDLDLDGRGGALYGWLLCAIGQELGWPMPEGGSGAITDALVRRLRAAGGALECGARVDSVVVRGGRATGVRMADGRELSARRAVVADVGAPALFLSMLPRESLPGRLVRQFERRFRYDHGTVKVDWALDGPIPWTVAEARRAGTVHIGEDLAGYAEALSAGRMPSSLFMLLGQYSMGDPTRAPAGCETAWAYTHVPQGARFDGDAFAGRMEAEIEALAPGFGALVRARHVWTPQTLEAADANLVGGAVNGGSARLSQQLMLRPVPALRGRASTPVDGLYLASASAHPGGGVHGACGANAARAALRSVSRRRLRGAPRRTP